MHDDVVDEIDTDVETIEEGEEGETARPVSYHCWTAESESGYLPNRSFACHREGP
jgi:hypothetical protein